jgi:hypothetical protein
VKHGQQVSVSNLYNRRKNIGLSQDAAIALRWQCIGGLWNKVSQEYASLIQDSMRTNNVFAALAAGKFLLDLGYKDGKYLLDKEKDPVKELCERISDSGNNENKNNAYHKLFSKISPELLQKLLKFALPVVFKSGDIICKMDEDSDSCFLPVSGTIDIELPSKTIRNKAEGIIGEFSLWIPEIKRTATVKAVDEGLCLRINTDQFRQILPPGDRFTEGLYTIVKDRIIKNILDSNNFFNNPDDTKGERLLTCEKYPSGQKLDLDKKTYIIFHGRVEIKPYYTKYPNITEKKDKLEISVGGHFGSEQVVGIISGNTKIDGKFATVIEETVAVSIDQDKLIALQADDKSLEKKWHGILFSRIQQIEWESREKA